ncbi:DNA-directed RNA polymerase V subunit 1-like [Morus notabilis]|uniref:DNA-directed RNA polymerase V subunit 1-like n=1 Tax=Morus notabilis TaxID=981085 RepID=UPI000CED0A1B|nr:DNA-directed RNA polymerase V subunit 1-like [Morus notabilis]
MRSGRSKGGFVNNQRKLQIRYHFHRYYGSKVIPRLHRREDRRSVRTQKKPSSAFGVLPPLSFISSSDSNSGTRLSTSVSMVSKGVLKENLVLLANSMTYAGNLIGFNSGGYKALTRSLNVQVPFIEATLIVRIRIMYIHIQTKVLITLNHNSNKKDSNHLDFNPYTKRT